MAKCSDCNKEILKAKGCTLSHIKLGGKWYERSTENFDEPSGRCHDCGAKHGNYHHFGCDVECCPKCGGQMIGCDCFGDAENVELSIQKKEA